MELSGDLAPERGKRRLKSLREKGSELRGAGRRDVQASHISQARRSNGKDALDSVREWAVW